MPRRPSLLSAITAISKALTPRRGYVQAICPSCGLKINLRDTSIDTLRTCENCGQKFVPKAAPVTTGGCLTALVILAAMPIGCVSLFICGGSFLSAPPIANNQPVDNNPPDLPTPADAKALPKVQKKPTLELDPKPLESGDPRDASKAVETSAPTTPPESATLKPKYEVRTWNSASGKFAVEASFVRMSNGKVTLRKAGGDEIEVDEAKLSPVDITYIERLRGANKTGGR